MILQSKTFAFFFFLYNAFFLYSMKSLIIFICFIEPLVRSCIKKNYKTV